MKIWKKVFLYLTRKKSRNILLLLLIFAMGILIMAGNGMRISAKEEIEKIRQKLASSFTGAADSENMALYEERYDKSYPYSVFIGRTITDSLIEEICRVEGIHDYEVNNFTIVWTDLQLRPGMYANIEPDPDHSLEELKAFRHATNAVLCRNGELNVNFRTGAFSISDGRNIKPGDEGVVVLSRYLAEKNGVTVGDTITIETKRGNYEPTDVPLETLGVPVELTVIGIFDVNFEQEVSIYTFEQDFADNILFVDQQTVWQMDENLSILFPGQQKYNEVTFFVGGPEELQTVMERVEEQVDLSDLIVSVDDSAYQSSIKSLKQISAFAVVLMTSGTIGCLVILYLLLSLRIKERRHEIGIYLSVGTRKRSIIWQIMLECFILTFMAVVLMYACAPVLTKEIFHGVSEAASPDDQEEAYTVIISMASSLPAIEKVSSERITISYKYTLKDLLLLAVALYAITAVSVLGAEIKIVKLPPGMLLRSR